MSYLISATILLFAVWPAYYFLLRYSERYTLNRLLLLLAMVAAVALPFVSFESPAPVVTTTVHSTINLVNEAASQTLDVVPEDQAIYISPSVSEPYKPSTAPTYSTPSWLVVYGFGFGLLLLLMVVRLAMLLLLHLRSRPNGDGSYRLLHPGAKPGQAFTFGRQIYFSIDVPDAPDFEHILAHEQVHARQLHSLDILLTELFLCVFWFHPAAWWLRASTRANLEYLVDQSVIRNGQDRRSYQIALVRQSQAAHGLALTLPFSEPSLKSRIARMTGLAEYRVVASLAAVALLFWLGVAVLVLNGATQTYCPLDIDPNQEYLEAHAAPSDPYFKWAAEALPENPRSLEIYTRRMVTGNEYLQLRAIVSQFPGAKLYVHKQPYDAGYNLELQMGDKEPGVIRQLKAHPRNFIYLLGIDQVEDSGEYAPLSVLHFRKYRPGSYKSEKQTFTTKNRPDNPQHNILSMDLDLLTSKILVYVNGEEVPLIPNRLTNVKVSQDDIDQMVSVAINGVDITPFVKSDPVTNVVINDVNVRDLAADEWYKVRVEGRPQFSPTVRMDKLLGWKSPSNFQGSRLSATYQGGTYRKWYEDLRWPTKRIETYWYNDRMVSRDFLLDTDFGEQSMIQSGVVYDIPQGRYALQVIDDLTESPQQKHANPTMPQLSEVDLENPEEVTLYLRRLPTVEEVGYINARLSSYKNVNFLVYQGCNHPEGTYSFGVVKHGDQITNGGALWPGSSYDRPLVISVARDADGTTNITQKHTAINPLPAGAPQQEIFANVDGLWVTFDDSKQTQYRPDLLDPMPASVVLGCRLFGDRVKTGVPYWYTTHQTLDDAFEKMMAEIEEEGLTNRPIEFYINDRVVSASEFSFYQGKPGTLMQAGAIMDGGASTVIAQIIDRNTN